MVDVFPDSFKSRKILRAFLASPGDLQVERKAIREVVNELNELFADDLGYFIELHGWEGTDAGFGRPQHLINPEVDRCDIFIGLLWKRWGTAPDHGGAYSSGFEEEFYRAQKRREETGSPEITLYFKKISEEFLDDPGPDLKKVLKFRGKMNISKSLLYQTFSEACEIEGLVRKKIFRHVIDQKKREALLSENQHSKPTGHDSVLSELDSYQPEFSPLAAEGMEFLEDLVNRLKQPKSLDEISVSEIARFRLLANLISKPGNEEMNLGVHDINMIFEARLNGMKLGVREKQFLVRLGFQNLANENVPLWCWYSELADSDLDPAIISSVSGATENEKALAINVLTAQSHDLHTGIEGIEREFILATWFSEESSSKVRIAGLNYLARCGHADELEIAKKEYNRKDYWTSDEAFECMVEIMIRTGRVNEACDLILESPIEALKANLLKTVLSCLDGLENHILISSLDHRNAEIRISALRALKQSGNLDINTVNRLIGDKDVRIRNEALSALLKLGKPISEDEVERILIPKRNEDSPGSKGNGNSTASSEEGRELYMQYEIAVNKELSEEELIDKVGCSHIFQDAAYFALVEKYSRNHGDRLRQDIDDKFTTYFGDQMRRIQMLFGENSAKIEIDLVNYTDYVRLAFLDSFFAF